MVAQVDLGALICEYTIGEARLITLLLYDFLAQLRISLLSSRISSRLTKLGPPIFWDCMASFLFGRTQ